MISSERVVTVFILLFACSAVCAFAVEPNPDIMALSIEELANVEVVIAAKKPLALRETPGVVTVINRMDILNSGARDLLDVLTLLVPGITFGGDVEGAVGISLRGMWAHEGKVLLMIDGQEANEEQFATTQFGNHYPVENIDRIEIVRGPGSAIYGGYAGVGVINVITKGPESGGVWASALYSQMKNTYSHRNFGVGFGHKGEDLSASLSAIVGQGNRSDRDNRDISGNRLSMEESSELNFLNLNLNLNYRGLDLRAMMDRYDTTQMTLWGDNYQGGALDEHFDSYFFHAKYAFKDLWGQRLEITPEWKYKIQFPWQVLVPDEAYTNEKSAEKMEAGLSGIWDVKAWMSVAAGIRYYTNDLLMPDAPTPNEETFRNNKSRLGYTDFSSYAELMLFNHFVNATIGGRYDNSDEYGSSMVPRIGLTRVWGRFHGKAMYSQSFRLPGGIIPNRIPEGFPGIDPEKGNSWEIEVGCQITDEMMLNLNAFDITFDKAIVYESDPVTGVGSYFNSGKFGSRGFEAEYRYQGTSLNLLCNYAYYHVSRNTIDLYEVPGHDETFLAFPQHRLNVLAGYRMNRMFSVHPSLSLFGKRYGYAFDESQGGAALETFGWTAVFNVNVRARDVILKGLDIHLGVRDLFDSGYEYIQAYDGGAAPLPGPTRSIYMRIAYAI